MIRPHLKIFHFGQFWCPFGALLEIKWVPRSPNFKIMRKQYEIQNQRQKLIMIDI